MKTPKIQIIRYSDREFTAILKNVPVEIANALRRTIMSEVETIAIEDVIIFKNDSVMNDDSLAHRLGLIPLKTSRKKIMELQSSGDGSVSIVLKKSARKEVEVIYSGDLKIRDRDVKLVSDRIPIVKLAPGQSIEVEAWAKVGSGSKHSKWSPVTVAVVRGLPKVKLSKNIPEDVANKLVEICPKDVFKIVDGKLTADELKCTLCDLCMEKYPDYINISIDEESSILMFESVGQLSTREILESAFEILENKLDEIKNLFMEVELNVS